MAKIYKHVNITQENFDLVTKDCINEFLKQNPNFKDIKITQDFIIGRIARYYLDIKQPKF